MNIGPIARHADPDFVPSLRLLVERERYSLHDIGLMFNVSRERVRQWCERYEIEHPDSRGHRGLRVTRVWDDVANRFTPVFKGAISATRHGLQMQQRRQRRAEALTARRERVIAKVVALRDTLGRDPTLCEVAEAVTGRTLRYKSAAPSYIVNAWGDRRSASFKSAYGKVLAALREATGYQPRPRGHRGHIRPNEGNPRQALERLTGAEPSLDDNGPPNDERESSP